MKFVLDQVSVAYGRKTVVDSISLELAPGLHALLGHNGAGKTSLIKTLVTLRKPSAGHIHLGSAEWPSGEAKLIREQLGYLPQDNIRKSRLTVSDHLSYMCWLRKIPKDKVAGEVDKVLAEVNLEDKRNTRISALSGGMRRRVGVGSAIIGDPSLVVLDEPSAGLDVSQRESLRGITERISKNAIVIVSTHIVEDVLNVADTITVMKSGKLVKHCPREEFARPGDLEDFENQYVKLVRS